MRAKVGYSVPMLSVMDVERSVKFYELLGFKVGNMMKRDDGKAFWAWMSCYRGEPEEETKENESAALMLNLSSHPIYAKGQGAKLYMYSVDLPGLRERLGEAGVQVSEIEPRFYMEKGEMELRDPDGYVVLVGAV